MAKKKFADLASACWKGYKAVGLKDKNGRKVPNCVPEETEVADDIIEARVFATYQDAKAAAAPGQKPKLNPSNNKYILVSEETIDEEDDYSRRHTVVAHVSDNTGTPADGEKREVIKKALSILAATPKHAERAARKHFSDKGYKVHKISAKLKEEVELEEATVSKKDYSWGKMMTVHHGKDISYPLHPEHQKIVKGLRPSGEHSKAMYKDETGNQVHVTREDDKVHFVSHRTSGSKKTTVDYKHFDESVPAKNTDIADKSYLKDMGKKPSIKSDLKNFKNFLTGKKETNEEVEIEEASQTWNHAKVKKNTVHGTYHSSSMDVYGNMTAHKKGFKTSKEADDHGKSITGKRTKAYHPGERTRAVYVDESVEQVVEAAPFKTKEDAVKYAKEKVKTHRDNLDGIEIYAHSGGFDVNHTMNASGRNSLQKIKAKHIGTIYKEEVETVEEGWYQKPASAYRRKGDEIGGGSSKNSVPFDGPYTKTKPVKNSDGTTQSPMSRARELAKQAIAAKSKIKEDVVDEQAPVAPVPDKKYIKGTPENKAYKATKKPINGHPTNKVSCEEVEQIDELDQKTLKSYVRKNLKSGDTSDKRDAGLYTATNKIAKKQATSTLDKKVKTLGQTRPSEVKNRYEYEASRSELKNRGIHHFAGRRTRTEEVEQVDEKAPPGFEGTVKAMKKHKEIDNPFALAWYMKNKGMKSHKEEVEQFDDNGEVITNMKTYKEFVESLDEVKMADLPVRKVSGRGYGTEYYKGEAEADKKGYDDEDKPAKPAAEKRGRGRPAGSTSGARQKGTIAKRKGSGVEMTGYPVHLPNFK